MLTGLYTRLFQENRHFDPPSRVQTALSAPRTGDWTKLIVVFEHPSPKDFTTQVSERKCHFGSTCGNIRWKLVISLLHELK